MMITFQLTQRIDYPLDKTFAFLSNLTNMPRWNYFIQRVTKLTEGPVTIGTRFEQKRPRDLFQIRVEEFAPPHHVTFRIQPPGPDVQIRFELFAVNLQTEIQYSWQLDVQHYSVLKYIPAGGFKKWILSFVSKQIHARTKPAVAQNFAKLKTLLETGEVVLQDGRQMTIG